MILTELGQARVLGVLGVVLVLVPKVGIIRPHDL
jgi:hypothetical protein